MQTVIAAPVGLPVAPELYPTPPPAAPTYQLPPVDDMALYEMGWPKGLTRMVANSVANLPIRFVIVDNSGSMQSMDGQRLVLGPSGRIQSIPATRWAELSQAINEMADVAVGVRGPTHFHFLNPTPAGQFFAVAGEAAPPGGFAASVPPPPGNFSNLKAATASSPSGTTPLTEALMRVDQMIRPASQMLRASGQKAVICITTDGLPNDPKSFLMALQNLQTLPVWVVVRLCTSDDSVVDYWSDLDKHLEMSLETLDDLASEAKEVHAMNPFLAYGPALHMARMFGVQDRIFDLLDEKQLLPTQAKEFAEKLLGCTGLPEPDIDPKGFGLMLNNHLKDCRNVYNPVTKRMGPWVDTKAILKLAGHGGCVVC